MKQGVDKLGVQYRYATVDRAAMKDDSRTVDISFSSETPVERWWGTEILDHSAGSVRMNRMDNGAAALFNHDPEAMLGVVENARIEDKVGRATVRFSRSAFAEEKLNDIRDGVLRNVSVGYLIHKVETTTDGKGQNEVDRVTDWEPVEVSFVAVPADPTVGVGRSAEVKEFPVLIDRKIPAEEAVSKEPTKMADDVKTAAAAVEVKENNYGAEAAAIVRLAQDYKIDPKPYLEKGASLDEVKTVFADIVLARAKESSKTSGVAEPTVSNLTERERKDYSISRLICAMADKDFNAAGLEREVSKDLEKRLGAPANGGIYIPTRLNPFTRAGLDTKTDAAGKYTVQTDVRDLIDLLRNRLRVAQLGATFLSGLSDTLQFPVQSSASTGSWVAENPGSDVSDSDAVFASKTMTPKIYQASTSYSRKLLAQSSIDVESFVRGDLATAHALAIDLAAINGSGSSNQPLGLLGTSGIGIVYAASAGAGGNGDKPTYTTIVDLETAVANANADEAGMKFLTTPTMRGKLRKTEEFATTNGRPVWTGDGSVAGAGAMLGYDAWVSKQVPSTLTQGSSTDCHAIIFGYWPSLLVGEWGVIEIVVDPYRLKKQGMIETTSYQAVDVLARQPAAFAACKDARNV